LSTGKDRGAPFDRRRDGVDRRGEIIGFAGQEHEVVGTSRCRREHRRHGTSDIAERALDDEAVAGELLGPPLADEERHIGAVLGKAPAKISADAADPKNEDLHRPHLTSWIGAIFTEVKSLCCVPLARSGAAQA
jgi:hypothetical protein